MNDQEQRNERMKKNRRQQERNLNKALFMSNGGLHPAH